MLRPVRLPVATLLMAFAVTGAARAQVLGPIRGLPATPLQGVGLQGIPATPIGLRLDELRRTTQALTRRVQIGALLREQPGRVALDPQGEPVLRGEFLALDLTVAQRVALPAQGFSVVDQAAADAALGLNLVVVRDSRRRSEADAMRILHQAAPGATFTYQHLYLPAGDDGRAVDAQSGMTGASAGPPRRVGLIDGGVDAADPALAHAHVVDHGCARPNASRHGTAVAARLVDGDAAALYAADLWCDDAVGGATSNLIDALGWMAREQVPVINISLVGPDNPVLARAVQAMLAHGHVLVAAAGNDGPAAPPLFPAAYPGVIGVGAVDAHDRVLPESARGEQVAFCALGVVGSGIRAMRGTSFAAPIVARRAAQLLDAPHAGAAAQLHQQLAAEARPLGSANHDPRCGAGLLAPGA